LHEVFGALHGEAVPIHENTQGQGDGKFGELCWLQLDG
jgi:hypothetical protein